MLTILFDESKPQTTAPAFRLPDSGGNKVTLSDQYEKGNLVLLFIPDDPTARDLAAINEVVSQAKSIAAENAHVLALSSQPIERMDTNQQFPFPLLADAENATRARYAGLIAPGFIDERDLVVFILDSYGVPCVCLVGGEPEESFVDELLSWLLFLSIQCPE